MSWIQDFDERQRKEIELSRLYARDFHHGTDGHNAKMIIAEMAAKLDEIESSLDHAIASVLKLNGAVQK